MLACVCVCRPCIRRGLCLGSFHATTSFSSFGFRFVLLFCVCCLLLCLVRFILYFSCVYYIYDIAAGIIKQLINFTIIILHILPIFALSLSGSGSPSSFSHVC